MNAGGFLSVALWSTFLLLFIKTVNGTTGEGVSLTVIERKDVLEAWMKAAQPYNQIVRVQIEGTNMKGVKHLARHAEVSKISSVLCLADLFFKLSKDKTDLKKCKKTLNILEIAATDKENITSRIHKKKMNTNNVKTSLAKRNKKNNELDNKAQLKNSQLKLNVNNNKKSQSTQSETSLESDLTVDNPSENYWKNLAESCRKALDSALKENVDLHNKVNELEYENSRLKTMLDEAKSLVEVLSEMIEEKSEEPAKVDAGILDDSKNEATSDSDLEDMSFQSCV